jgi:hypothetical protein
LRILSTKFAARRYESGMFSSDSSSTNTDMLKG